MADNIPWEPRPEWLIDRPSMQEYLKMVLGTPAPHDDLACTAMREYVLYCDGEEVAGRKPRMSMSDIGSMYHVTMDDMKKHWPCVDSTMNRMDKIK